MSKTRNREFATFFKQPSEKVSFSSALSVPPIFMRAQGKKLLYKIHKIPLQVALLHLSCVGFWLLYLSHLNVGSVAEKVHKAVTTPYTRKI